MAITDLTGTTWVFNNPPDIRSYPYNANFGIYINFVSNGAEFARMYVNRPGFWFYRANGTYTKVYDEYYDYTSTWERYKRIRVTGGQYATDSALIAWFEANAVLYEYPYRVKGAALTATADAIREKGGTTEQIEWTETGFADAIMNIVPPIPSNYGLNEPSGDEQLYIFTDAGYSNAGASINGGGLIPYVTYAGSSLVAGATITFYTYNHYILASVTGRSSGNAISFNTVQTGQYTFVMPNESVYCATYYDD